MTASIPDSDQNSRWQSAFHGSVWLPIAFVVVFSLWVLLSTISFNWLVGSNPSTVAETLWNIPSGLVQFALALLVLRSEDIRLRDVGFGRRQFVPALVTAVGFLVAVNAVMAGLVVLDGGQIAVEPFALYRSPPLDYSAGALVATGVAQYLFVGPAEELAFRGYLQNKLATLVGHTSARLRTTMAIVATAVVFSLLHVPTLVLVDGVPLEQVVGTLVVLVLSGITFGTVYALTRNLFLVAFLHGVGNFWPLVVDPGLGAWPHWGVIAALYGLVVALYRQWTTVAFRSTEKGEMEA